MEIFLIKPACSTLFKMKQWLSLADAAKYLSIVCSQEVTEADILQFAINGQLELSLYLINDTMAKCCRIVDYEKATLDADIAKSVFPDELKRKDLPNKMIETLKMKMTDMINEGVLYGDLHYIFREDSRWMNLDSLEKSMLEIITDLLRIDKDRYVIEDSYETLAAGLWDLSMIGNERREVNRRHHNLNSGQATVGIFKNRQCTKGVFVKGPCGEVFKLQLALNGSENQEYQDDLHVEFEKLKKKIPSLYMENFDEEAFLYQYVETRMELWKKYFSIDEVLNKNYYPMSLLSEDAPLVVRPEAIREFEELLTDNETGKKITIKTNGHKERHAQNREQILGAAFAVLAKWPEECCDAKGGPAASKIARLVDVKANLFWPNAEPPLAVESIADHLRDWIKKANTRK